MSISLVDVLKVSKNPLGKAILLNLLRQTPILPMLPVDTVDALKVTENRWQTLPEVGTRRLNEAYTESTGTLEPVEDTLHLYGGDISMDRIFQFVNTTENPLMTAGKMKAAALGARFNYDFIANDHATGDADGFEGLAKRVSNNPARCTINLETAGDTLKVLASTTTMATFIDALHQALHVLGVSHGDAFKDLNVAAFMNETTFLGIGQVLRRSGLLSQNVDNFGRIWGSFGPAKLIDVGLKGDQSTEIISSAEVAGDAGTDSTSIYFVRFGGLPVSDASGRVKMKDDDGLRLIQLQGTSPEPYDPNNGGEGGLGVAPAKVKRIDWAIGLKQAGSYSIVRVKGFKMAAS